MFSKILRPHVVILTTDPKRVGKIHTMLEKMTANLKLVLTAITPDQDCRMILPQLRKTTTAVKPHIVISTIGTFLGNSFFREL
jgi:hypothetical protein